MKIYAREDYGMRRFDHAFFGDSQLTSFKHLILKPFASFWPYSGTQDYVCNALARQLNVESPLCRPMVVYINGEYWGLYFIQEKTDERFLEDHYGVNPDACNIIGDWKGEVEQGSGRNFKRMMRWLEDADLSKADDYEKVCEMIDIDNYIDYMVFETFVGNWDWPGNNMRCWQVDDGPWRWMFFDGDYTMSLPHGKTIPRPSCSSQNCSRIISSSRPSRRGRMSCAVTSSNTRIHQPSSTRF